MKRIHLTINGCSRQVVVEPDLVLLDLLRGTYGLTGAKQSCDRKGQCGACTVIVNKKAVRSCLVKVKDLEGADIITVEGLGTPDNPHLIQEAFVLSGAIQCGYCTPGMIMGAKALLDRNPSPTDDEIKHALRRHLCRCTGYNRIVTAVQLAASFLRGENTPDAVRPPADAPKLGVPHQRPSSLAKACGTACFSADLQIADALELAAVRSPHFHARILNIDASKARSMPGVAGVITARDIKGSNRLKMLVPDRPLLCEDKVHTLGDPVAVVAADTLDQARAAADAVVVEYQVLPVIESPQQGLASDDVRIHDESPNLCHRQPQIKGDADAALASSTTVVEAHLNTQINHQAPLEPEHCAAWFEGEGDDAQLVVRGRSINIHAHLAVLQQAVGWENMRYEEAFSGGQFGIKVEITSEGIAAAAAVHFRRPVRYTPSLAESMIMTPKRHPFSLDIKLGADADGMLTGMAFDFLMDNGAYMSIGSKVMERSILMLSGSYNIPNVNALGRLVYTNNPWGSAARGAGPPQTNFALEVAMEMLARKTGRDSLEFRKQNSLHPGQSKSTGRVVEQWPFPELCDAIEPRYRESLAEKPTQQEGPIRKGVGLAAGAFGICMPGDASIVAVELDKDGGVTVFAAGADPGEGNDAMFQQLAAEVMGLPFDKIRLVTRDTDRTTATGAASGSRITYMVGGAMVNALEDLKKAMEETGARTADDLEKAGRPARYVGRKKNPDAGPLDPDTGQGPSLDSQVHAIQLAKVEVNTDTGEVQVENMITAVDAGPVINPHALIGQLEGGMDMGAGYALREQFIAGKTRDYVQFKYPTMATAFPTEVIIRETPRVRGVLGSTGVGEMTMVPTAPAIINAIYDACGVWVTDLPVTPDKLKVALAAAGSKA